MIIKTEDFILRPIKTEDCKDFYEVSNDREAKRNLISTLTSSTEAKKKIKKMISDEKKKHSEAFAIEINGEFAGFVAIKDLNKKHFLHRATIGYALKKKFRGRGIMTKAVKIVSEYAMKKYKLKRLEGYCRTFNKASAKVLENAGFKLEGILRKNKCVHGRYLDDMVWAKIK